ncbi:MAG: PAS domain S-box protein [Candidatus Thermoplasmatota archaeon]|jgi:PAS domain S-box-containing protein|nr:PAS domain S-box protein [Candidatus Thermoplasmatota archaeon]
MARKGESSKVSSGAKGRAIDSTALPGLLNDLLETSNAIIIGIDGEGRIKLFNNGARRALGYTNQEVEGTSWFDLLSDTDSVRGRLEVFKFDIGSGARTQYESRVRASSGLTVTILLENTMIFGPSGEISMVLMVGQDISRTKELERSLMVHNDRLIAAQEELALFADLLLHDMKNANAGIMGCLDLMGIERSEKRRRDLTSKAISEVMRATSIINDVKVVTLTRPQWEPSSVDIDDVLSKSVDRVNRGREKSLTRFDVDRSGLHVMADDLLEEAMVRIFEDCLDTGTGEERLRVEVRRDISRSDLIPQPVRLTITGCHSKAEDASDNTLSQGPPGKGNGSKGMGMFLVKRIISRYNGLMFMEMTDEGRTIEVLLSEAV